MAPYLNDNAVWFVTGCSNGLGKALALHVYNQGHNIVATSRSLTSLGYLPTSPKVLKLTLDVTSQASITSAIDTAVAQYGRIDVVINNAGYGSLGEAESFPEEDARAQFETNFWGPMRITKDCLRVFRDCNAPGTGGTVVQVSSLGGYLGYQGTSIYNATKFALEGYTKAIAKEVKPEWNINFLILSPGGINTEFASNVLYPPRHPAYAEESGSSIDVMVKYMSDPEAVKTWAIPEKCAEVLFSAVVGQNERPLPKRLNMGQEALPMMRADVKDYLKEMEDWEKETVKVAPDGKS